jgi:transcription antitermination factor NusG
LSDNKILSAYSSWNALYVKSRHEKKVALLMEKFGLSYYLPMVRSLKIWSDRKKWVLEPLFRGYIFVPQLPTLHEQYLQVPGVVNFVRYNKQDATISADELMVLQMFVDKGYHVETVNASQIKKGDIVQVLAGPFVGLEAEVIRSLNNQQCLLALESLGQIVKVTVPLEIIVSKKN